MKVDNMVLDNELIYSLLSKTKPNFYCVFINPNGIVDTKEKIKELGLKCTEDDLNSETLLVEVYDSKAEAQCRVEQFNGNYINYFCVSCCKNGVFISDNQK
jgi:hypothetical protein